jgi:predicted enzyme related to lactoylglutathione lyase
MEHLRRRRRCRQALQVIIDDGGSVLRPAEDTPYGRLAAAADPTGTMFNLSSQKA